MGGAATGGAIDASVGGASFLIGTVLGGAVGGVLGWLGADRLVELSVVDRLLGGRLARFGPSRNANFLFFLVGRARFHAALVASRTHARRGAMELSSGAAGRQRVAPRWIQTVTTRGRLRDAPEACSGLSAISRCDRRPDRHHGRNSNGG